MSSRTSKGKVLLAMSGGVDSSVAAALLLREGYDVVGCFMRLGSPGESLDELLPDDHSASCDPRKLKIGHQGCCSINDAADARLVAAHLGIPFYVCNFKKDFGRIIDYFVDEYAAGRTPNPCVRCNDWLKFGKLHEYARQIDADFIASGHYARIGRVQGSGFGAQGDRVSGLGIGISGSIPLSLGEREGERGSVGVDSITSQPRLLRAVDHAKDQSYVLFGMPRQQLTRTLLPIGEFEKSRVRDLAREFGLPVADKPDSQEICFVPGNDYAGLVERRRPGAARPGDILDESGAVIGAHEGHHRFTIGQRRGVALALGQPVYVVAKDPARNTITVGPRERLLANGCTVNEANWLIDERELAARSGGDGSIPVFIRHRSTAPLIAARLTLGADGTDPTHSGRAGRFSVEFDEPLHSVTPGQALVVYDAQDPDWVLGGGWIEKPE